MVENGAETPLKTEAQGSIEPAFVRLIIIVMLFTIGITLGFFSFALIKDVETLRNVPGIVWNFICGSPTSADTPALPLMLTISTLFLLGGIITTGWHIFKLQHEKQITV